MERKEGRKEGREERDELSRIGGRTIKFRRGNKMAARPRPTGRAGDGHGKPRFARKRTNERKPASYTAGRTVGSLGSDLHAV